MDWDKLRIFHAVADAGSLTHAGDALHLSQSAVSRQIRALEEALGTTLFHRHARGLILTEQGELLFEATSSMAKKLDSASARIRDSEEEVFGELRVTTTTDSPEAEEKIVAALSGLPGASASLCREQIQSYYWWDGSVQDDAERRLCFDTDASLETVLQVETWAFCLLWRAPRAAARPQLPGQPHSSSSSSSWSVSQKRGTPHPCSTAGPTAQATT